MILIYPAIIHEDPDGMWLDFPDLEGCQTQGDSFKELLDNAAEALEAYALTFFEDGKPLPAPSEPTTLVPEPGCFVTLAQSNVDLAKNTRSIKKTLTIPAWLNELAVSGNINFSNVLQKALMQELKLI